MVYSPPANEVTQAPPKSSFCSPIGGSLSPRLVSAHLCAVFGGIGKARRIAAARVMACHLLDTCTNDLLLRILSSVSTAAADLARLSLTCRHFGAPVGKGRREHSAREGQLCLVQQAGRRWLAMCSDQELSWVPRRGCESWLWLMHEVELLRLPLAFAHAQYGVTEWRCWRPRPSRLEPRASGARATAVRTAGRRCVLGDMLLSSA